MEAKTQTIRWITGLLILFLAAWLASRSFPIGKKVLCASFDTQKQAQKLFESNSEKYVYLDKNHDGIACNKLLKNYVR